MARVCQICEEKISILEERYTTQGLLMHRKCIKTFVNDPKKYGGVPENLTGLEKRFLPEQSRVGLGEEEFDPVEGELRKETKRRFKLREKSKGMVLTDIDLPFSRVLWVSFQFILAGLILAIPIWFIVLIVLLIASS